MFKGIAILAGTVLAGTYRSFFPSNDNSNSKLFPSLNSGNWKLNKWRSLNLSNDTPHTERFLLPHVGFHALYTSLCFSFLSQHGFKTRAKWLVSITIVCGMFTTVTRKLSALCYSDPCCSHAISTCYCHFRTLAVSINLCCCYAIVCTCALHV